MKFITLAIAAAAMVATPISIASAQTVTKVSAFGKWQVVNMGDGETCALGAQYEENGHSGVIFTIDAKKPNGVHSGTVLLVEVNRTISLTPNQNYDVTFSAKDSDGAVKTVHLVGKAVGTALVTEINDTAGPLFTHGATLTITANGHTYPDIVLDADYGQAFDLAAICAIGLAHPTTRPTQ